MAKKQQTAVMSAFDVREMIKKGELTSEIDMERAVWAERSLRLLSKEQSDLEPLRKQVKDLIQRYESLHWSDFDSIPKKQFKESDKAEKQVKKELQFFKKRKELILSKLQENGLNQNDLAALLSHSKSYTSELLSGTRSFSLNDLVIIHRFFDITLENLICTALPEEIERKFNEAKKSVGINREKDSSQITPLAKSSSGAAKLSKSY
ncbi:helix-turn-helix domain-containing protein [Dyadobacter luticola]|uniref:Helix-turn-helix transcriptional regulator n=1 Tax=Dyadobacter luticola TaxID=1979387 RepID=A0A5R9KXT0_9BACT|nr:helix-turn-helix domain-containing protein [Dyadobacter luticola]TLV00919.1 helix-turn-helix transcriptional regulator [Dyadobacter luticola]